MLDVQEIVVEFQAEGRNSFLLQSVQINTGAQQTSSLGITGGCLPMVKSAGV
jgi:hypothetical protein